MSESSGNERGLPEAARWAAVVVLGLAGLAGVIRAWVIGPTRMLEPPGQAHHAAPDDAGGTQSGEAATETSDAAQPPARSPGSVSRRINVNAASAAELDLLPGIGPALASLIIADRETNGPYTTLDDLDRVPRIGPKTIAKLAPYAAVE